MNIPPGWKLVPKTLTPEMRAAAKRAMTEYIKKLSPEVRARMPQYKDGGGVIVPTNLKFDLRYAAAVAAAPEQVEPDVSRTLRFVTTKVWERGLEGHMSVDCLDDLAHHVDHLLDEYLDGYETGLEAPDGT